MGRGISRSLPKASSVSERETRFAKNQYGLWIGSFSFETLSTSIKVGEVDLRVGAILSRQNNYSFGKMGLE